MSRGLKKILLLLLGLLFVAVAVLSYNPLWLLDHAIHTRLRSEGVRDGYVTVNGYPIHYLEAGSPQGDRPPLLLIHGLGARASDWAGMIAPLARAGYHVYAPDLLGYGDSPKPPDGDFSLDAEERISTGFMQALNIPQADVGGWSMGGWVAMKLALDHPEKVRRLMVYDSAGLYFVMNFPRSLFSPSDRAGFEAMMDRIEPDQRRIHVPSIMIPGMLRRFRKNQFVVDGTFGSMLHGREILDFRAANLKMPTLIVWGTEDHLIPVDTGLRLHRIVPQSVFVGVRRCGHLAAAECAQPVTQATLRFLDADPPLPPSTTYVDGPK